MISREFVRDLVTRDSFQRFIIGVIIFNAITLGIETSPDMAEQFGGLLHVADRLALGVFVVEILLRLYGFGWKFFKDSWNVFDLVIIAIAVVPATGQFSVLRALRILRVLRLISVVPTMRRVVSGLLAAVPGLASIAALLALVLYVAGVMATKLFQNLQPEYFADLGRTLFTLFQIMTGEGWSDIVRELMAKAPLAWIFFVAYIIVSSFAVLNLFIAVVVSNMDRGMSEEQVEAEERHAAEQKASNDLLLSEMQALRSEIAELRASTDNGRMNR